MAMENLDKADDAWRYEIETVSGRVVNLLDPKPESIHIHDIIDALLRIPRFTGHTKSFYSVAQHSLEVYDRAKSLFHPSQTLLAWALLHDAHEAYIGDLSRPLIETIHREIYRRIPEANSVNCKILNEIKVRIDTAIWNAFRFPAFMIAEFETVKLLDEQVLRDEAYSLMPTKGIRWHWSDRLALIPMKDVLVGRDDRLVREDFIKALKSLQQDGPFQFFPEEVDAIPWEPDMNGNKVTLVGEKTIITDR